MASGSENLSDQVITFKLYDNSVLSEEGILTDKLTDEEYHEMCSIVTEFQGNNSRDLIDFLSQQPEPHHKAVTPEELDRLASKNNAESTGYQTKWAITILRGNSIQFLSLILLINMIKTHI